MPTAVTCACSVVNRVHEDAELSLSRCAGCGEPLGKPGAEGPDTAKKKVAECFLCEETAKGRKVTFYSGVRKGGSTTKLMSATVTVFERWSELQIHEIHVCRACQLRLWKEMTYKPPILFGVGAAMCLMPVLPCVLLLPLVAGVIVGGLFVLAALGLGGAAAYYYHIHRQGKPDRDRLEELVMGVASRSFIDKDRSFMTMERYLELVRMGILD